MQCAERDCSNVGYVVIEKVGESALDMAVDFLTNSGQHACTAGF